MDYRIEHDTMGEIAVPKEALWGAQTQRSLEHFQIAGETMPLGVVYALVKIKKAAALTNFAFGKLDEKRKDLIVRAADEVLEGKWDKEFPLSLWQTGSGTQTNMNVNEVLGGRGNALAGEKCLHPNDHVNLSQSSNDVFPAAMHLAALASLRALYPAVENLIATFKRLEEENASIIKTGRTHLQDAVPLRFSQEISGWRNALELDLEALRMSEKGLYALALGGTAVGTGLNSPKGFSEEVTRRLSEMTGLPLYGAENKFQALTSKSALVTSHGAIKALAADYYKITTDVRFLSTGPRCGLGEILIPENEPGSSIMPGKVNPTQCESAAMVSLQVMANDVAVGLAASQGNFELNVFMPLLIGNFLRSAALLRDSFLSFEKFCASGIKANEEKMKENLERSLMNVTALSPLLGYEKAALVAKTAHRENKTLKEVVLEMKLLNEEEFDEAMDPEKMV